MKRLFLEDNNLPPKKRIKIVLPTKKIGLIDELIEKVDNELEHNEIEFLRDVSNKLKNLKKNMRKKKKLAPSVLPSSPSLPLSVIPSSLPSVLPLPVLPLSVLPLSLPLSVLPSSLPLSVLPSPYGIFIKKIIKQRNKEIRNNIWKDSNFKKLIKLQKNNVGNTGETFVKDICKKCDISNDINGEKMKGHGIGDGFINNKSIEIKTAYRGSKYTSFQHELGEIPWKSDFMIFIDVDINCLYFTIFKNFTEEFYKNTDNQKCDPYFPTKIITWRKRKGSFKLDTSIQINENNVIKGNTMKITEITSLELVKDYIMIKIN